MDYFERIDEYLNKTLSESEKFAFEEEMEKDPKLKQAVDDHGIAMEVVGSILESEVRGVIKDEESRDGLREVVDMTTGLENAEKDGVVKRMNWMRWAAAAAVIFVVGWWGVNQFAVDNSELFAKVYSDPSWPAERGGDETELSNSIMKYFNEKPNVAKSELSSRSDAESKYWLSEIYLKEMKYDSALLVLPVDDIFNNKNKRDRINYVKILSLYFSGAKDESKEAITKLPQDTDSYYDQIYSDLSD